jgi:hypothetical protein
MAAAGAEQPALAVFRETGGVDIRAQRFSQRVMARHVVFLAAFLMQPNGPAGTARPQILDLHIQRRANPRERVGEGGDQRPVPHIAQRHVRDRGEQLSPLAAFKHRRLAGLDDMLRTADRRGGICRHDLAGDQPVASCCLTEGAETSNCNSSI